MEFSCEKFSTVAFTGNVAEETLSQLTEDNLWSEIGSISALMRFYRSALCRAYDLDDFVCSGVERAVWLRRAVFSRRLS